MFEAFEMILAILQSLITLLAVALGWFLNNWSQRSRRDRAAIGKVLVTLVFFRRRLAGIKYLAENMEAYGLDSTAKQQQFKLVLHKLVPQLTGWQEEFHEAVSYLAGIDPMLALSLRNTAFRADISLPDAWHVALDKLPAIFEEVASKLTDPASLDEPIKRIARLHGRRTLASIKKELQKQDNAGDDLDELISQLAAFAGTPREANIGAPPKTGPAAS